MKYKRLGEMLINAGILTEEQLSKALEIKKGTDERLGTILVKEKFITEAQLIETLCKQMGIEFIDLASTHIDPGLTQFVPKAIARKERVIPVRIEGDNLYLAMEDPMNFVAIESVRNASKKKVIPLIAYTDAIKHALTEVYENEGASKAMEQMKEEGTLTDDSNRTKQQAVDTSATDAAPTVRLVNSIIERAISEKASDIHVEPGDKEMIVRLRVDGRLTKVLTIPKELQAAVISRFKVMSGMDISERRIPQDGRALVRVGAKDIDLRLNTLPTIHGEKVVLRILSRDEGMLSRHAIGITEEDNVKIDRLLKNTSGVILIVGPTGSGKTSTMYTLIREMVSEEVNMITLEDPVEFQMEGITQCQINEKIGMTFSAALRSCLRQDPDIIGIGEIRDGETAEIAMRAAMTGHLVISTIHTEDAVSALDRLKDMGVEPYLIAGAVRGIIAQRLPRRICPACKKEVHPDATALDIVGIKDPENYTFYKGEGCQSCFGTGYRGRCGVFEVLLINSALRDLITDGYTKPELRKCVKESGYVPMIQHGRELVKQGITTVDELIRTISILD